MNRPLILLTALTLLAGCEKPEPSGPEVTVSDCPMRDLSGEHLKAWDEACENEKYATCAANGGGGPIGGPHCLRCVDKASVEHRGNTITLREVVVECMTWKP